MREVTREPEVITKARKHVADASRYGSDGSAVFLQEESTYWRIGDVIAAYDTLLARLAALEAERDEAWKAHHAVREGWAQLHANMRQCESLLDESEAERDALAARVAGLETLVREVGASGVEHHTRNYVVAQIDPDTFEACRALAAAPTPTTDTEGGQSNARA